MIGTVIRIRGRIRILIAIRIIIVAIIIVVRIIVSETVPVVAFGCRLCRCGVGVAHVRKSAEVPQNNL